MVLSWNLKPFLWSYYPVILEHHALQPWNSLDSLNQTYIHVRDECKAQLAQRIFLIPTADLEMPFGFDYNPSDKATRFINTLWLWEWTQIY